MKPLLAVVVLAAACAGANRHTVASAPGPQEPVALEPVRLVGPRAGELSASREWQRYSGNRVIERDDDAALRARFTAALERLLPVDTRAPVRLRATLILQDTGYFEGLAAETTDVTLRADLIDARGNVYRTITLREPASAPLQRSVSRKERLEAALDRLAQRLVAQL